MIFIKRFEMYSWNNDETTWNNDDLTSTRFFGIHESTLCSMGFSTDI